MIFRRFGLGDEATSFRPQTALDSPRVDLPDDLVLPDEIDDEVEYVVGDQPVGDEVASDELPDEFKGMSKAQLASLLAKQQAGSAAASGEASLLERLSQQLSAQQTQVAQQPANAAGKSKEEWLKEINEKIVNSDNPAEAIKMMIDDAVGETVGRLGAYVGPMQLQQLRGNAKYPYYEKFGDEISKLFGTLQPGQQTQPGAADWAYNTVVAGHIQDIIAEEKKAKPAATAADTFGTMPAGNANKGSAASPPPRKKVYIQPNHIDRMISRQTGQDVNAVAKARYKRENLF